MNPLLIDADESNSEVEEQLYSQAEETLKTRNKLQHLDYAEKLRLYNMYYLSKTKIDDKGNKKFEIKLYTGKYRQVIRAKRYSRSRKVFILNLLIYFILGRGG